MTERLQELFLTDSRALAWGSLVMVLACIALLTLCVVEIFSL